MPLDEIIGVEAGPAGPVLAGSLFWQLIKFIIKIARALHTHLSQPDHFKSPSYAPGDRTILHYQGLGKFCSSKRTGSSGKLANVRHLSVL